MIHEGVWLQCVYHSVWALLQRFDRRDMEHAMDLPVEWPKVVFRVLFVVSFAIIVWKIALFVNNLLTLGKFFSGIHQVILAVQSQGQAPVLKSDAFALIDLLVAQPLNVQTSEMIWWKWLSLVADAGLEHPDVFISLAALCNWLVWNQILRAFFKY